MAMVDELSQRMNGRLPVELGAKVWRSVISSGSGSKSNQMSR